MGAAPVNRYFRTLNVAPNGVSASNCVGRIAALRRSSIDCGEAYAVTHLRKAACGFYTSSRADRGPGQALNTRYPVELYAPSARIFHQPEALEYPFHDRTIRFTHCGLLCFDRRKISLSRVFADQDVGIREVRGKIWLVSLMKYDLGFFDADERPGTDP